MRKTNATLYSHTRYFGNLARLSDLSQHLSYSAKCVPINRWPSSTILRVRRSLSSLAIFALAFLALAIPRFRLFSSIAKSQILLIAALISGTVRQTSEDWGASSKPASFRAMARTTLNLMASRSVQLISAMCEDCWGSCGTKVGVGEYVVLGGLGRSGWRRWIKVSY